MHPKNTLISLQGERTEKRYSRQKDRRSKQVYYFNIYKIGFKPKLSIRDREKYYIHIKRKIHHKDITILNIYAPHTMTSKFIKETQLHLKSHIDPHTDSLTPLSTIDRSSRQKLLR